jgi:large subunit ribosomal protein L6
MSRVGKSPVPIPHGVTATVAEGIVKITGPKGELEIRVPDVLTVVVEGSILKVGRSADTKEISSLHGTIRALIAKMVKGVSEGYQKNLDIIGVGYSAEIKGRTLQLKLGYSHPIKYEAPKGIDIEVPEPTRVVVKGIDSQQVGEEAAKIRAFRPPEPYKGKGIRYHDEYVKRKAGKLAVSSGA